MSKSDRIIAMLLIVLIAILIGVWIWIGLHFAVPYGVCR